MLYFLNDKKDCTACTACMNVCPIACVSMIQDEEGFEYPVADDSCIHCKKCEQVCPIKNNKTESKIEINQYAAAAVTQNKKLWEASTSGGAFTEICNAFGDNETVIFGAKFDGLKVVHDYVVGVDNTYVFRKSKYVQSSLSSNFNKAKELLEIGNRVIFSGTPCQIAGLKSFLNKEYDNLLCIDLICHGVGSPKVFLDTIQYTAAKYGAEVREYSFRNKSFKLGNLKDNLSVYKLNNGKSKFIERDEYSQLFYSQLCLRPSCGSNCKFRSSNRLGDITIADFKNKSGIFPKLKDYKNYSTIIVNSEKGDIVFNELHNKMSILSCEIEDIKKYNPLFYKHTKDNPRRDEFFEDYLNGLEIDLLINKYSSNQKQRNKQLIKDLIPYRFKVWYRNLHN